ncbi:hypothetical protein F5884DRAFT_857398 [Xylogone sp. PMI_703]|nr:hypothetical protein F5884DRAFT_857398 [Xylogone sp. PMI_703]
MAEMPDSNNGGFEFVMQEPNEKFTKETQTKIRKQAMRAVGAARQYRAGFSANPRFGAASRRPAQSDLDLLHPIAPMPLSGLELLVKDRGLDPMDLSALTSVHMGDMQVTSMTASAMITSEPNQLADVLVCRQWSYFSFIPPRFGHFLVLDDAFRCLVTATHSMLVPSHKLSDGKILSCYGRALRSLQSAVNNPTARYSSEVLCATGMLALFELLNSPLGALWSRHIAGASHLIRARGPSRFNSEFDKALFIALSYPISAEALSNNESCFLDSPTWTGVFEAAILPHGTFTDRSQLGIDLMMLMAKIPRLAKRTGHAVTVQGTLHPVDFDTIAADVRIVRSAVLSWRRRFNNALIHESERSHHHNANFDKRFELLGISLIINILVSRMLCCLVPSERALLEEEVQNLAAELKAAQKSVGPHRRAGFFLAQKAKIADAVIATHADFLGAVGSGKVVESWRLKRFCDSLGRKCCDGETCCSSES